MDKLSPNVNIIPKRKHQILRRVVSRFFNSRWTLLKSCSCCRCLCFCCRYRWFNWHFFGLRHPAGNQNNFGTKLTSRLAVLKVHLSRPFTIWLNASPLRHSNCCLRSCKALMFFLSKANKKSSSLEMPFSARKSVDCKTLLLSFSFRAKPIKRSSSLWVVVITCKHNKTFVSALLLLLLLPFLLLLLVFLGENRRRGRNKKTEQINNIWGSNKLETF